MHNFWLDPALFNPETNWETREQILLRTLSANMSDVERAKLLHLPDGCRIRENAKIISQGNLKIGINCWIGEGAILDASGGLEIGDNTSIGLSTFIWTHDSHALNIRGQNTRDFSHKILRKRTKIGSNCFIAGPSIVMPGVSIGDKCIIAPLSIVYKDLPDRTIYKPYSDFQESLSLVQEQQKRIEFLEQELKYIKNSLNQNITER